MPACAALCLALWIAAPAAPAGGAPEAPGAAATAAAAVVPSASPLTGLPTSGESLLQRRWRLDSPLPTPWGPLGVGAGPPEPREESDEELGGRQHYPARRSLHWLPSGLGTNWDLRGENAHPVRHPKSHHGRHHGQHAPHPTAGAPAPAPATAASSGASEAFTPTTSAATSSTRTAINRTLESTASAPSLERFVPLALSSASRGDVADVVVVEPESASEATPQPGREDDTSIRIRPLNPAVDVACYSSNQVLIIIAMTCMLSLGFIAVVMGCVHCCTTSKSKEASSNDDMVDICDARDCHRSCRACPRTWPHSRHLHLPAHLAGHHLPLLRRLVSAVAHPRQHHHARPEDADQSDDSEEELLFPAPSGPVASGSASMISLHSLHSVRERQSSVSMEDLLLLGRCR